MFKYIYLLTEIKVFMKKLLLLSLFSFSSIIFAGSQEINETLMELEDASEQEYLSQEEYANIIFKVGNYIADLSEKGIEADKTVEMGLEAIENREEPFNDYSIDHYKSAFALILMDSYQEEETTE